MDSRQKTIRGAICAIGLPLAPVGQATTITIDSFDAGWYLRAAGDTGGHVASNVNYVAGWGTINNRFFRNFFVFDLSSTTNTITSATLRLKMETQCCGGGYFSPDPTETYTVFDVSTSIATLLASGNNKTAVFDDLGSGNVYGSVQVSDADEGFNVDITLNLTAVADIDAATGGNFALGGRVTSLGATGLDLDPTEAVFQNSHVSPFVRQLILNVVPEPTSLALVASGLASARTTNASSTNTSPRSAKSKCAWAAGIAPKIPTSTPRSRCPRSAPRITPNTSSSCTT